MTITNVMARIVSTTGRYKVAVYSGNSTSPNTFLRGSLEVVNPSVNGWYNFPLTDSLSLTGGNYYWFAIWSDSSSAYIYYRSGTSRVRWGQYNYGNWPTTLTTESGMTSQNYSIYATNATAPAIVAPTIVTQPTNQTVTAGSNVNFYVSANGTAPLTYQWRKNNTNISGANSSTLTLLSVTTNHAGNYQAVVTNVAGSITSVIAILTVTTIPVPPTNVVGYVNVTIQWDPSPDATVTGYNFYYGVASRTYTNITDCGTATVITVTNLSSLTTYYFAATAYNVLGVESVFSDELVYTTPNPLEPRSVLGIKDDL